MRRLNLLLWVLSLALAAPALILLGLLLVTVASLVLGVAIGAL